MSGSDSDGEPWENYTVPPAPADKLFVARGADVCYVLEDGSDGEPLDVNDLEWLGIRLYLLDTLGKRYVVPTPFVLENYKTAGKKAAQCVELLQLYDAIRARSCELVTPAADAAVAFQSADNEVLFLMPGADHKVGPDARVTLVVRECTVSVCLHTCHALLMPAGCAYSVAVADAEKEALPVVLRMSREEEEKGVEEGEGVPQLV
eukprot:Rhum_TRINITY_DN14259_c8_g1::Rhum_TRINITY_DN14259_c8_g1_i1::g.77992::m.77992